VKQVQLLRDVKYKQGGKRLVVWKGEWLRLGGHMMSMVNASVKDSY